MGIQSIRLAFEPLRSLAYTDTSGSYVAVGTAFANPTRICLIQNETDAAMMFSLDGVTDHFQLPAGGFLLLDVTSNRNLMQGMYIAAGTTIYVVQIGSPSMGSIYVSTAYGLNG